MPCGYLNSRQCKIQHKQYCSNNERHFTIIAGLTLKKLIKTVCVLNERIKQILTVLEGNIDKYTISFRDFNECFSIADRINESKFTMHDLNKVASIG